MERRPITSQDLTRFHQARKVHNLACHRCGTMQWQIESTAEKPASAISEVGDKGQQTHPGMEILVLTCMKCGTLWSMSYNAILSWLEANPE